MIRTLRSYRLRRHNNAARLTLLLAPYSMRTVAPYPQVEQHSAEVREACA